MEGWLYKEGGRIKSWTRRQRIFFLALSCHRFFKLSRDGISYYEDEVSHALSFLNAKSKRNLKGSVSIEAAAIRVDLSSNEPLFELCHPDRRTYVLRASSFESRQEWIQAMKLLGCTTSDVTSSLCLAYLEGESLGCEALGLVGEAWWRHEEYCVEIALLYTIHHISRVLNFSRGTLKPWFSHVEGAADQRFRQSAFCRNFASIDVTGGQV